MPESHLADALSESGFVRKLRSFAKHPVIQYITQARHIPLLYSVLVVTSILYHYAPSYTVIWALVITIIQWLLFRLFDFVNRHHVIGGIFYLLAGILTLILASFCIYVGENPNLFHGVFAPEGSDVTLSFMVWFFTPQSVLNAYYGPFTVALMLLFAFFIASITYYFSFVRYRVFMSFMIMCFPFAIYAKEDEVMPIPFIIFLFAMYFAVMIFCQQLHNNDPDVIYVHQENQSAYLLAEVESLPLKLQKKALQKPRPEIVNGKGLGASMLFICGASILVLAIPKPTVHADRAYIEGLINMTAFTDYLLNSISAFSDTSDGGGYTPDMPNRILYYATASEPLNLRLSTYTYYDYETDSWTASSVDQPESAVIFYVQPDSTLTNAYSGFLTASADCTPYDYYLFYRDIAIRFPELAEEYGIASLADTLLSPEAFVLPLELNCVGYNNIGYLSPLYPTTINTRHSIYQSKNGVLFRQKPARTYSETYALEYFSQQFAATQEVQLLLQQINGEDLLDLILSLYYLQQQSEEDLEVLQRLSLDHGNALAYSAQEDIQTPESVQTLAAVLTEGLSTDYDKAAAICEYLRTNYTYDLDYLIGEEDNVETFLFQNKTGVCYQFASAMTELCRSAGLIARYTEGYSLSETVTEIGYGAQNNSTHVIRTTHAHAFTEVYLPGYGWMMFDATAADLNEQAPNGLNTNVINTLQYTGVILLLGAALIIFFLYFVIPRLSEQLFRRRFRRYCNALMVQKAFLRLKKQWNIPKAATAREACASAAAVMFDVPQIHSALDQICQGFEDAVYGSGCTPDSVSNAYTAYCALREAWQPAVRRRRKEEKAAAKAERAADQK